MRGKPQNVTQLAQLPLAIQYLGTPRFISVITQLVYLNWLNH